MRLCCSLARSLPHSLAPVCSCFHLLPGRVLVLARALHCSDRAQHAAYYPTDGSAGPPSAFD
eukprot:3734235-Rhodomonas_salina.2